MLFSPAVGGLDSVELTRLLPGVLGGEAAAWQAFVAALEPALVQLLSRSRVMGHLRENVDDCRAVVVAVLERLKKNDFRALRLFAPWMEVHPGKGFGDWIRIVATNRARDHVTARAVLETLRTLTDSLEGVGRRPAFTDAMQARQILDFAEGSLPIEQLRALRAWMEGASFEDVARGQGLGGARGAERLVRSALARLRRRFPQRPA